MGLTKNWEGLLSQECLRFRGSFSGGGEGEGWREGSYIRHFTVLLPKAPAGC